MRHERAETGGVIPHKIHPSPLKLALPAARLGGQPSLPWPLYDQYFMINDLFPALRVGRGGARSRSTSYYTSVVTNNNHMMLTSLSVPCPRGDKAVSIDTAHARLWQRQCQPAPTLRVRACWQRKPGLTKQQVYKIMICRWPRWLSTPAGVEKAFVLIYSYRFARSILRPPVRYSLSHPRFVVPCLREGQSRRPIDRYSAQPAVPTSF